MRIQSRRGGLLAAAIVVTLGLVAAGCGSGSSDEKAATTTTTARDVSADRAAAQAGVLRLADFPSGWVAEPHEADTGGPDVNTELAACLKIDPSLLNTPDNPTNADSPDFSEPQSGASVSNSIGFTKSVAEAKRALAIFAKPQLPDCLATVMTKLMLDQAPAGMTFGTVDVKRLSMRSAADETMAIRVVIPIESDGVTIEQYLDLVVLRVGRAGVTITFSNTNKPVPIEFQERIVGVVAARMAGAAGSTSGGTTGGTTTTAAAAGG